MSSNLNPEFAHLSLPRPQSTRLEFSSMDGFAYFDSDEDIIRHRHGAWPYFDANSSGFPEKPTCVIDMQQCFGEGFMNLEEEGNVSVEGVIKRIAFEHVKCGDCLIVELLRQSGPKGLDAFLPRKEEKANKKEVTENQIEVIGISSNYEEAKLTLPPNKFGLSLRDRVCSALFSGKDKC